MYRLPTSSLVELHTMMDVCVQSTPLLERRVHRRNRNSEPSIKPQPFNNLRANGQAALHYPCCTILLTPLHGMHLVLHCLNEPPAPHPNSTAASTEPVILQMVLRACQQCQIGLVCAMQISSLDTRSPCAFCSTRIISKQHAFAVGRFAEDNNCLPTCLLPSAHLPAPSTSLSILASFCPCHALSCPLHAFPCQCAILLLHSHM